MKVTFNGDTRKITSPPDELFAAISSRFSIDRPDTIQLQFDDQDVDLDWVIALASTVKPGKPLKVSMRICEPAPEYVPAPAFEPTVDDSVSKAAPEAVHKHAATAVEALSNQTEIQAASPADNGHNHQTGWGGWDKAEWKAWKNSWKHADCGSSKGNWREWKKSWKNGDGWEGWNKQATHGWNNHAGGWGDHHDWGHHDWGHKNETAWETEDPSMLKKKAKAEARAAKQAEKAYYVAEKAAKKAAAQAEKAARKAEKIAQRNEAKPVHQVMTGKLVNWVNDDPPAVVGDLTILPCGRVCFHAGSHQGNLRVNKALDIQKCGGKGEHAQFEAIPQAKPGVFRLASHKFPEHCLGVAMTGKGGDASLTSLSASYAFVAVPNDSTACTDSLWSFFPEGQTSPFQFEEASPVPGPREVYASLQQTIHDLAEQSKIPISMGDAPEDDTDLIEMLNMLHEILPHGLKRIAMKKLGLRQFDLPTPPEEAIPEEWNATLQELEEMGFDNQEDNLAAVRSTQGDLKQAVRHLVKAMHAQ